MKVLLTGANGFVGSHILDSLCERGVPTAILLRRSSGTRFISQHLPTAKMSGKEGPPSPPPVPTGRDSRPGGLFGPLPALSSPPVSSAGVGASVEVRFGDIGDRASLAAAVEGVTHIIHCAGCTKAVRPSKFYEINQVGTRNLIAAVNAQAGRIQRIVHISSLAAAGPSLPDQPAREEEPPHPVSEYGKSKLAAEMAVREGCRSQYVILRPPAVYGPRDTEFLRLFKAVKRHLLPKPTAGQPLSLVFATDLAQAAVACLESPIAAGKTYFVAAREIVTGAMIAREIAAQMKVWTLPLPLPTHHFWLLCLVQEIQSRLSGRANVLSLQKFAELRAPGWVCDPARLEREMGVKCLTTLSKGIGQTLAWYRENNWL